VITPRQTRLVRVPDLQGFREAIAALVRPGVSLVVVPTRSAARQLQRRLPGADCVTRDELYERLHGRLASAPRRLTALERDVIAQAAARHASTLVPELSFRLRPGLVAELLRFYDDMRRHGQRTGRFEALILDALGSGDDEFDRGAVRIRRQTQFLAEAFREYERRAADSGACDEHLLRERLIATAPADPIAHIVVTVPDWIADPGGLHVADFDLLARLPGLEALDIVATEGLLASGFYERLHNWWPGLEEVSPERPRPKPFLMTPNGSDEAWWVLRDPEEELAFVARQIKADRRVGDGAPLDRWAVVFKRPLPYLYLAAETLPAAGIRYQSAAALPLAAEPVAASVDLALEAVSTSFARAPLVALLRSPHFSFEHGGSEVTRESTSALDRLLSDRRYLGELSRLEQLERDVDSTHAALPALRAAVAVARELAPLVDERAASQHVADLLWFWERHLRPMDAHGSQPPTADRELRARGAVREALAALAAVHAVHDDPRWTIDEAAVAVRRTIEDHTFEPDRGETGVHLVDDQAARYGDFDDVAIAGLIESDWPDRPRRNIFYPPAVLKALGWPSEHERRAAADARFLELVASASRRTWLLTFTLDDDALVSRSTELDEIPRARLSSMTSVPANARIFVDEALALEPAAFDVVAPDSRVWASLRASRSSADAPEFHGTVGSREARAWSVSALETYLDCPFKFFARHVLQLQEEPDDEEIMDPRRQGQFVHDVFEQFFHAWQDGGHRAITAANLDAARELFAETVEHALEALPEAEAGLERTRLLGSPAAAGLGEAVFRMEAERPVAVVERLLEHELRGAFTFATAAGERAVSLRGKADRLDLLEDGTFRLIDYKLGWPPNRARALQLPIYSLCAEQRLVSHRGRRWMLGEAMYLAFKGPRRVVPLFTAPAERTKVLAQAQQRLVDTIDAIEAGLFPPTPDDVYRCETCAFASVCRKDYVGEV
jgi:RecB family exonuclease